MRTHQPRIQIELVVYDAAVATPVLLAETDFLFCAGVAHALQTQAEFALQMPSLRDQATLEAALAAHTGAIALVSDGLVQNLTQLAGVAASRDSTVVLLTTRQHSSGFTELPAIRGALRRNSDGKQLIACLQSVAGGNRWYTPASEAVKSTTGTRVLAQLTPRQIKVMSGVSRGAKNIEIARELGTSEQVVKNMLGGIYDLAGVSDRLELALFVLHHRELAEAARASADLPDDAQEHPLSGS